jgi:hypothetical protein
MVGKQVELFKNGGFFIDVTIGFDMPVALTYTTERENRIWILMAIVFTEIVKKKYNTSSKVV